jgi:hypothetical protein
MLTLPKYRASKIIYLIKETNRDQNSDTAVQAVERLILEDPTQHMDLMKVADVALQIEMGILPTEPQNNGPQPKFLFD